jgi:TrmH family RNA methyltransferase
MHYSSVKNEKIKNLKKLNTKKYRDIEGKFLVEGKHLIMEAHKSGYLEEVFISEKEELKLNIPISSASNEVLKYISELETPTMLGICKKKQDKIKGNKILILDDIRDPGNLGTIIRSAVAFNVDTIIMGSECTDLYNSKVLRATEGLLFKINIVKENLTEIIPKLKKEGYFIYASTLSNQNNLEKKSKFAIIVGNEGMGIKKEILELADSFITIPMNEACESLNVAVATSILLYELR